MRKSKKSYISFITYAYACTKQSNNSIEFVTIQKQLSIVTEYRRIFGL